MFYLSQQQSSHAAAPGFPLLSPCCGQQNLEIKTQTASWVKVRKG